MTPAQQLWMLRHPEWTVVSSRQHHADYARAANGRGRWMHDRLLCPDGELLPGDSFKLDERIYVRPPPEKNSVSGRGS